MERDNFPIVQPMKMNYAPQVQCGVLLSQLQNFQFCDFNGDEPSALRTTDGSISGTDENGVSQLFLLS